MEIIRAIAILAGSVVVSLLVASFLTPVISEALDKIVKRFMNKQDKQTEAGKARFYEPRPICE